MTQLWRYAKTFLKVVFRRPLPGVTLIPILPDGRIVLIQRRDTGEWGLPGGLIDWGETLECAAARELKEETGLTLVKIERLLGVYSQLDRDPRLHSISISLAVSASGNIAVNDLGEVVTATAFVPEALPPGKLSHDHNQQLTQFLQTNAPPIID